MGDDIIVTFPDGSTVPFPAGTAPDVMNKAAAEHWANLQMRKSAQESKSTGSEGSFARDVGAGLAKGAAQTVTDIARLAPRIFGAPDPTQGDGALSGVAKFAEAKTGGQKFGKTVEQIAEFAVPGMAGEKTFAAAGRAVPILSKGPLRVLGRMGTNAAVSGAHGALHNDDPTAAALSGALFTGVGEAGGAAARWVGRQSKPLIKSGLKLTNTDLKAQSTSKWNGMSAEQDKVADFLLEKRWTQPAQAEARLKEIETLRNDAFAASPAKLNSGQAALDALDALAAKAKLRSDGGVKLLAAIDKERKRIMLGPLSKPGVATTAAAKPAPAQPIVAQGFSSTASGTAMPSAVPLTEGNGPQFRITGTGWESPKPGVVRTQTSMFPAAEGQPPSLPAGSVPTPIVGRAPKKTMRIAPKRVLRTDVTPTELKKMVEVDAEDLSGQWGKPVSPVARAKNVALRKQLMASAPDPEAMAALNAESGLAQRAKKGLDNMHTRQDKREVFGFPLQLAAMTVPASAAGGLTGAFAGPAAGIGAGAAVLTSEVAMGTALHLLRNNPLKAGYLADDLAKAVAKNDGIKVGQILQKLGIGSIAEATAKPEDIPREGNMTVTGGKP